MRNNPRRTKASRLAAARRKLNAQKGLAPEFSKYYDFIAPEQIADNSLASEIWGDANSFQNEYVTPYRSYGNIIGVALIKPQYEDALPLDDPNSLNYTACEVLDDGSLIMCLGGYTEDTAYAEEVDLKDLESKIGEVDMNSKKKMNSSTKKHPKRRTLKFNSAKQIDAEWFYTLSDMETVVQAVLEVLDKDEGASIVLEGTDTGVALMVTSSEGEETSIPVDLNIEGDELADSEGEEEPIGEAEEY